MGIIILGSTYIVKKNIRTQIPEMPLPLPVSSSPPPLKVAPVGNNNNNNKSRSYVTKYSEYDFIHSDGGEYYVEDSKTAFTSSNQSLSLSTWLLWLL
mmetsp:Transcript_36088/g.40282  ORF Transcript_36088/g.40282 Transcript_36088/m.40282 type:complete len:97 (+) Transcript_36088:1323-1613(+)